MKRKTKNKFLTCIIAAVLTLLAAVCAIFSYTTTAHAYNTADLPTGTNAIGNIYKDDGKFDKDNLDALAKKAGYTGIEQMVTEASKASITATTGVKTSADFGGTVVNFGSYTFNGNKRELTWIPTFLSNTEQGAVLTLWLASSDSYGSQLSNQEYTYWSDGSYSNRETQTYHGSTIYSDTYDGSYIRHYILHVSNDYTSWSSGTSVVDRGTKPAEETMTKFTQFTAGALSSFIVSPKDVYWQKTAGYMKNDPEWNVSSLLNGLQQTGENYPSEWLEDKLWLPSVYEVCDSTVAANSLQGDNFTDNGGLWGTSVNERKNEMYSWLRTGYPESSSSWLYATHADGSVGEGDVITSRLGIRPAFHLNLSAVLDTIHTHNWEVNADTDAEGWKLSKPATCSAKGEEERVCTVDDCPLENSKETRETAIDPTAHNYGDWVVTKEATCTAQGEETKTCSYNSAHKETRAITASGHDYDYEFTVDTEATCTTAGSKSKHCKNCTDKIEVTPIPILGHDWSDWQTVTEAGCTSQGLKRRTCNRSCGVAPEEQSITATGHSYTDVVTDPTCEAGGKTTHTCTNCGDSYVDGNVPANGHAWGAPVWQWAANYLTCSAKFTCSTCNKEQTETASVAHNSATASCTVAGDTTHTASVNFNNNSYSDNKVVSGQTLPHTWQLQTESIPPDCVNDGAGEFECTVCHKVETRAIEALGHDFADEFTEDLAATCTEDGSKSKHCSRCTEKTEVTAIPATGHTAGTAADCTTAQTCTVCGTELAAALGHNYEAAEGGVAPTCTEEGSGKLVCSRCNDEKSGDTIPALGHDWATEWSIDETNHWHICSRCDEVNDETAHTYDWVITKEATTEEAGLMENICTACGNKDGEQEIAKLIDPNGEIDLPVDINVEFKVTQSSTDNDYSNIDKGLKRGYWAQLWYRNDDGTLGDEFVDKINCFLTLKIPTDIIEAIRGGEEINRDKIAAGLKVFYIDGDGAPVEVDNFTIAMRDDDSWQIKFNYNEKFRAEVVFAADLTEQPEPASGIPWWVWLIVGLVVVAIVGVVIVIIVVAKKKGDGGNGGDTEELKAQLAEQGEKIDELLGRDDGGFNTPVELDENGNVIFK